MKLTTAVALSLAGLISLSAGCADPTQPIEPAAPPSVVPPAAPPSPDSPPISTSEDIYVANSDGTGVTRLTSGGRPAWSPDGQKIAFHHTGYVHVINADGSNETRLVHGAFPAWSPTGKQLVFSNRDGISVMNADGSGGVTTLIHHDFRTDTYAESDAFVNAPSWSPDGRRIAFVHAGDGDMEPAQIYTMGADGSDVRLLNSAPGAQYAESDPSWSPDGLSIAYWSYGYGIATVDADGGLPKYLNFPAIAYGARPVWSDDGKTIAFSIYNGISGESEIWILSVSGNDPKVLVANAYEAAWSPAGGRIAFVSTRSR